VQERLDAGHGLTYITDDPVNRPFSDVLGV
jgi:hypothetical protein